MLPNGEGSEASNSTAGLPQTCCRFELDEILLATQNFKASLVVGKGGFGKVYKGNIRIGATYVDVAIKRLDLISNQGAAEFWAEVETLSKLRHAYLVSLIGYCNYGKEMILVYEYMPHGTLEHHLHKLHTSLSWIERLKICIGAARGLDYLHTGTGTEHGVIHRDVKSSNILLHESWTAKISDFGLARIGPINKPSTYVNTLVKGTFGYIDPNYFATGKLTRKSDVYAFGVVLFEVLCQRQPLDVSFEYGLATWIQDSIKEGKLKQIVYSGIQSEISPKCLRGFARIAKRCLDNHPNHRPTMTEVVFTLESLLAQSVLFLQQKTDDWLQLPGKIFGRIFNVLPQKHLMIKSPSISLDELNKITENFGTKSLCGENLDYCKVFQGKLSNGEEVIIKKFDACSFTDSEPDFEKKLSKISRLKNEYLSELFGYCLEKNSRILVYQYSTMGCLHDILHGRQGVDGEEPGLVLNWAQRVKVAYGAARGLEYVHEQVQPPTAHCDISSSNVLVSDDFESKIVYFSISDWGNLKVHPRMLDLFGRYGFAIRVRNSQDLTNLVRKRGYPNKLDQLGGYDSPEYAMTGQGTQKSDVFSFGIVLLELLTGRKPVDHRRPSGQQSLLSWAMTRLAKKRVKECVDPRLNDDYPPKAVAKFAAIAALCVQYEAEHRPNMRIVVKAMQPLLKAKEAASQS